MHRRLFTYLISSTLSLVVLLSGAAPAGAHGTTSESSSEPFAAPDKSIAFYVGGDLTKDGQTGPQYSDLSRIAMERASTAEEAVTILGDLIDEHGYTTYGGNSHLFADENEGWVFVEFAGGEGLWAAERLGSDEIRV